MPTVSVTTSPTTLDSGSSAKIRVTNLDTVNVTVAPFSDVLTPGAAREYYPVGAAVTGTVSAGTATVIVEVITGSSAIDTWVIKERPVIDRALAEASNTVAASTATYTIPDVTTATVHDITVSANCTFTMPTAAKGKNFHVIARNGGTFTATWTGVKWPAGSAPVLTSGAGKADWYSFISFDGTNWIGRVSADVR